MKTLPSLKKFLPVTAALAMAAGLGQGPASAQPAEDPPVSFTAEQVSEGEASYRRYCADCHGENLNDGEFGGAPLRGSSFEDKWFDGPADALFDFMVMMMPPDQPGGLSSGTYANLMAYILRRNGLQPGTAPLPGNSDALANFEIR